MAAKGSPFSRVPSIQFTTSRRVTTLLGRAKTRRNPEPAISYDSCLSIETGGRRTPCSGDAVPVDRGDYPNHLGHADGGGCFRCHNSYLVDDEGRTISVECTLCHSILALRESEPFKYLFPVDEDSTGREMEMHRFLQDEFLQETGR